VCDLETTKILVNEEEAKAPWGAVAPRDRERERERERERNMCLKELRSNKPNLKKTSVALI
jgi:hypothetical protein